MRRLISRWADRTGAKGQGGELTRLSADLMNAVALSEKEYLSLGSELQGLHEKARQVSESASSLMRLGMGDQLNELTQGMHELFGGTTEDEKGSGDGAQALKAVLEMVSRIEGRLQGFRNVVRSLQMLRNFISIEAIRFGDGEDDFQSLSQDVRSLASTIQEKSGQVMDESRNLTRIVSESLESIHKLDRSRQEKGARIAETVRSNARALEERHRASSEKLSLIGDRWQKITASIGEIVSSLQFHDITRQRIEHVDEALKIASTGTGWPPASSPFATGRVLQLIRPGRREVFSADTIGECRLQEAQLRHTGEELESAVGRIGRGLQEISARIDEMSLEARGVTRDAQGKGGSFYAEIEKAVTGLTQVVREQEGIHGEMAAAVEKVTNAVSGMDGYLREIVKIGIEMKMIALNAAIHAAHVGEEGLALGVLAEHLHLLSRETSQSIDAIGEDLNAIFIEAGRLKSRATRPGAGGIEERIRTSERLQGTVPLLEEMSRKSMSMLESIEEEGKNLAHEIQARAVSLHFHEPILASIVTLAEAIRKEVERSHAALAREGGERGPRLEGGPPTHQTAERYTMEREREVHRAVLGMGDPPAEAAPQAPCLPGPGGEPAGGKKSGDDLGDNVELF